MCEDAGPARQRLEYGGFSAGFGSEPAHALQRGNLQLYRRMEFCFDVSRIRYQLAVATRNVMMEQVEHMKRNFKIAATASMAALLCLMAAYLVALRYWTGRTAVTFIRPPEKEVMWTGTISTTNGWEFTLVDVLNFERRNAAAVLFCKATRQLFIGFSDKQDDACYQWDLDTGKCVYAFHAGDGFRQVAEAVSPDGNYLIVTRYTSQVTDWRTLIVSVEKLSVVAELGDLGAIFEVRFSSDCKKVWLRCGAKNVPSVFQLDGTPVEDFSVNDFLEINTGQLWDVAPAKSREVKPGLFFKDSSGVSHLLATNYWHKNYGLTKDGKLIVASNWNDELVVWDAGSAQEIVRQRITNHHNGGGYVIYDETTDRFLIADASYQGTTHLRALVVTKRPTPISQLAN